MCYFSSISFLPSVFCRVSSTSPSLCLCLSLSTRNGIYPMTAFGLPSPQQPQQETVKSPIVVPLVKSPTPEPAELETRRVRASLCCVSRCWVVTHNVTHNHPQCCLILFFPGCSWDQVAPVNCGCTQLFCLLKRKDASFLKFSTSQKRVHIIIGNCSFLHLSIISMQVIQMQCSVEPVEEGAKYHVSRVFIILK